MTNGRDAYRLLTRHFFVSLFDFGILSDAGTESFKRVLLGAAAVAMALGLLLVRMYLSKYASLAHSTPLLYQQALSADHAFLIAVPMWLVAVSVVLVGHSLFPDETDFRVLMVQPISRGVVFAAKLTALLQFVALIVIGAHASLFPLLSVTLINPQATTPFVAGLAAHWLASAGASACAAFMIVAVQGALILFVPRAGLVTIAAAIRSALLFLLVVALPLVARLPAIAAEYAAGASWFVWVPPAWFESIERALLGDVAHGRLAVLAAATMIFAAAISALTYFVVYRRFDRLTVRPGSGRRSRPRRWMVRNYPAARAVRIAIARFTAITLRRSVLHQGIIVAFLAAGLGVVVNALLMADAPHWIAMTTRQREALFWTMVWSMFAWITIAVPSVRLGLSVPIEPRANWVFRMSEEPARRVAAIDAAVLSVWGIGVAMPMLVLLPGICLIGGLRVILVAGVASIFGSLVTEVQMRDWTSIPLTSSYIPGKGFVPQMFLKGFGTFVIVPTFATASVRIALAAPVIGAIIVSLMAVSAWLLLRRRRQHASGVALTFEDQLPMDVSPLRLNGD